MGGKHKNICTPFAHTQSATQRNALRDKSMAHASHRRTAWLSSMCTSKPLPEEHFAHTREPLRNVKRHTQREQTRRVQVRRYKQMPIHDTLGGNA